MRSGISAGRGRKWLAWSVCAAGVSVLGAPAARGQTTWPANNTAGPTRVTIPLHGVAPEPPDLRYQLLPRASDLHSGNAALEYATAVGSIPADRPAEETQELDTLQAATLADVDEKAATALLARYASAMKQLHLAARYDRVDWQSGLLSEGFAAPLPNLAPLRHLSEVLVVGIRLDLKRRDFTAAHEKLQTGFALARHLGEGDTIIQGLVGVAIAGQMTHEVEEWIGTEGSPNLFWPLAYMPRPLLDAARGWAMEKDAAYFSIPELRQMREGRTTAESWTRFTTRSEQLEVGDYGDHPSPLEPYQQQMTATAFALLLYPPAKEYLEEHEHLPAAEVEKMPVAEVLGRYFPDSFDASMDRTFRYMNLPPSVSLPALRKAEREFGQPGGFMTNILARVLLPSLSRALYLTANANRTLDALQVVEAVRGYEAAHGALPASLGALELPIPNDPMTAKAFDYSVTPGGGARLESVPPEDPSARDTLIYELTVGK